MTNAATFDVCNLFLGAPSELTDIYIHYCDIQDKAMMIWMVAERLNDWPQAAIQIAAIRDLLGLAIGYTNAPILQDLRFLEDLAMARSRLELEQAAKQVGVGNA